MQPEAPVRWPIGTRSAPGAARASASIRRTRASGQPVGHQTLPPVGSRPTGRHGRNLWERCPGTNGRTNARRRPQGRGGGSSASGLCNRAGPRCRRNECNPHGGVSPRGIRRREGWRLRGFVLRRHRDGGRPGQQAQPVPAPCGRKWGLAAMPAPICFCGLGAIAWPAGRAPPPWGSLRCGY